MTDDPAIEESSVSDRAHARCEQILQAASQCFREKGFHGASIAQISKASGMSAGHIYHYFENKEAIIAAIVAQDLERLLTLTAEIGDARDVRGALLDRVGEGVIDNLDADDAGLKVEIVAEAARNATVAQIVRAADRRCRASLEDAVRTARRRAGHPEDEATVAGIVEVFSAMFSGLMLRSIRNPELDRETVTALFKTAIEALLDARAG